MSRIILPKPDYDDDLDNVPDYEETNPFVPKPDYDDPKDGLYSVFNYVDPRVVNVTIGGQRQSYTSSIKQNFQNGNVKRHETVSGTSLQDHQQRGSGRQRAFPDFTNKSQLPFKTSKSVSEFGSIRRENSRKFDTMNSSVSAQSCRSCPLCREISDRAAERHSRPRLSSASTYRAADERSGGFDRVDEDPTEIDSSSIADDFPSRNERYDDGGVDRNTSVRNRQLTNLNGARAARSWKAGKPAELDVMQGEFLEVLIKRTSWWKCRNVYGEIGWVPARYLFLVDQ